MTSLAPLLMAMVAAYRGPVANLAAISERPSEAGLSGASVRFFDVALRAADGEQTLTLVVKDAALQERRVYAYLQGQGVPSLPFTYVADLHSDARQPLVQLYLPDPAPLELPPAAAEALAVLHLANLPPHPAPTWLPRADAATLTQMVDAHWRVPWQRTLAGEEIVDSYGVPWPPCAEGATFAARFAAYTAPLEVAAAHFLAWIAALWEEGEELTLIHGDLTPSNVRFQAGQPFFIDWGQACYGPLYLDLPVVPGRAGARAYHAALVARGLAVPLARFWEHYHEASRYTAFRGLALGLYLWRAGAAGRDEALQGWIDLALQGR